MITEFPFWTNICRELVIIALIAEFLKWLFSYIQSMRFPDLSTQDYVNGSTTAIILHFRLEHTWRRKKISQKTHLCRKMFIDRL